MTTQSKQGGFGLLEVLVTLVIVAVGMLGIAALHVRTQQTEFESYQRSQALILMQDMVQRITANRNAAGCYTSGGNGNVTYGVGNTATPACGGYGTPTTRTRADADMVAWDSLLKGSAEIVGASQVGAMTGARGCVTSDPVTGAITISVAWEGVAPTGVPSDTCGKDQYGDEKLRRVVSTTIRIADLN